RNQREGRSLKETSSDRYRWVAISANARKRAPPTSTRGDSASRVVRRDSGVRRAGWGLAQSRFGAGSTGDRKQNWRIDSGFVDQTGAQKLFVETPLKILRPRAFFYQTLIPNKTGGDAVNGVNLGVP
ncbi:MAG TPA: hypothetical protein VHO24_01125, partial [Opitutaceae bacterium]|nr:hypothetical protein [Opitutaceae bacterium]